MSNGSIKILCDYRLGLKSNSGIGKYGFHVLSRLIAEHEEVQWIGIVSSDTANELPFHTQVLAKSKFFGVREGLELTNIVSRTRPTVFYSPAPTAPLYIARPYIITIHDLNHLRFPKVYGIKAFIFYHILLRLRAIRASYIITDSQFSQNEIKTLYGLQSVVAYAGVDVPPRDMNHGLLSMTKPYLLFVGNNKYHKNFAFALEVARASNIHIVAIGPDFGHYKNDETVTFLSNISESDLFGFYSNAIATLVPSLYEGFGLTALEAIASGCSVIASPHGSLPEVVGDNGWTAPLKQEQWLSIIHALQVDNLKRSASIIPKHFLWESVVNQVWAIISKATFG